jgi:hypothetical protein
MWASLILLTFAAVTPMAARPEGQSFTVYEARGDVDNGVAYIERLPKSPQALRGLIAMYAYQAGGACDHHDELGLRCTLTTALGLGPQCSKAHLDLVRATFPTGIPIMDWSKMGPRGKPVAVCYEAPDTASVQLSWTAIQVTLDGNSIRIVATAARMDHPDCGFDVRFESVYRVRGKVAEQISNHVTPSDWTKQCPTS